MSTNPNVHIPGVLTALHQRALPHRILNAQSLEANRLDDWVEENFPFVYTQINWSEVPFHRCVEWSEIDDLIDSFREMVNTLSTSSLVVLTWSNALCPAIEMKLGDIEKISREVFEAFETSLDNMVICRREGWLIEMHHEGTLCFGETRTPSRSDENRVE